MVNLIMFGKRKIGLNRRGFIKGMLVSSVVLTLSFVVIFVVNQQTIRQSANDPQLQTSLDVANQLSSGSSLDIFNNEKLVDIESSLSPYLIVFNNKREVVYSSARLGGKVPTIPVGVLEYTRSKKIDSITWQPRVGVRQAVVVRYYEGSGGGFVLSGRSLVESEARTVMIEGQMIFLWLASLVVLMLVNVMENREIKKRE